MTDAKRWTTRDREVLSKLDHQRGNESSDNATATFHARRLLSTSSRICFAQSEDAKRKGEDEFRRAIASAKASGISPQLIEDAMRLWSEELIATTTYALR